MIIRSFSLFDSIRVWNSEFAVYLRPCPIGSGREFGPGTGLGLAVRRSFVRAGAPMHAAYDIVGELACAIEIGLRLWSYLYCIARHFHPSRATPSSHLASRAHWMAWRGWSSSLLLFCTCPPFHPSLHIPSEARLRVMHMHMHMHYCSIALREHWLYCFAIAPRHADLEAYVHLHLHSHSHSTLALGASRIRIRTRGCVWRGCELGLAVVMG